MALSALLSRMLLIGGRSPNKVLFAKDTGRVFQQDFYILGYGERGWPEQQEGVPFRWGGGLLEQACTIATVWQS